MSTWLFLRPSWRAEASAVPIWLLLSGRWRHLHWNLPIRLLLSSRSQHSCPMLRWLLLQRRRLSISCRLMFSRLLLLLPSLCSCDHPNVCEPELVCNGCFQFNLIYLSSGELLSNRILQPNCLSNRYLLECSRPSRLELVHPL
jgi:hypothetical protein